MKKHNLSSLLFIFIAILSFCSCLKTEKNAEDHFIHKEGEWSLIFSSGGRKFPDVYKVGDFTWKFENQKLTQTNHIELYESIHDYQILDTLGGRQLKLDGRLFANITLMNEDSIVLHAEVFTGCGGQYVLVR